MLLLIWCGALCSFTDPSLWLLHSRSPPAPPPQMIVSTRALLSVRLCVPQSVHAGWPPLPAPFPPPPSALCGCQVPSSCPMHPHSSVTSFSPSPAVSFFSSSSISCPFPGHLSGLYTRGGCSMVHFLNDLDKALFRPDKTSNLMSAPRLIANPFLYSFSWKRCSSATGLVSVVGLFIWLTLTGFRWSTLPVSVTCLKPLLCGLLLASDLHLNSRASLYLVSADIILSIRLVFACCCSKIGLMEHRGLMCGMLFLVFPPYILRLEYFLLNQKVF